MPRFANQILLALAPLTQRLKRTPRDEAKPGIPELAARDNREVTVDAHAEALSSLRWEVRRNCGYLARQEIESLKKQIEASPKRLEHYGYKVYSQTDEDGMLAEIFKRIGVQRGVFCEIGVEDGLECNTLYLLHQGWRGAWLEGNPNQQAAIESKFAALINNKRLTLRMGLVRPQNINAVLDEALAPLGLNTGGLDFLSIDIDGMDIYLLEAIRCKPKVICIEYNAKFAPPVSKRPVYDENYSWRGTDYMGSSLCALHEVAVGKGYSLVGTNFTGGNAFFVRNDLIADRFDETLTPEALYNPPRYWLWMDHYLRGIGHPADFGPYTDLTPYVVHSPR